MERDARINEILRERKEERETKRKMLFYLSIEEERLKKLQEEEEARKLIGLFYHTSCSFMQYFGKVFMLSLSHVFKYHLESNLGNYHIMSSRVMELHSVTVHSL